MSFVPRPVVVVERAWLVPETNVSVTVRYKPGSTLLPYVGIALTTLLGIVVAARLLLTSSKGTQ